MIEQEIARNCKRNHLASYCRFAPTGIFATHISITPAPRKHPWRSIEYTYISFPGKEDVNSHVDGWVCAPLAVLFR
jgi:hypothetical protein